MSIETKTILYLIDSLAVRAQKAQKAKLATFLTSSIICSMISQINELDIE